MTKKEVKAIIKSMPELQMFGDLIVTKRTVKHPVGHFVIHYPQFEEDLCYVDFSRESRVDSVSLDALTRLCQALDNFFLAKNDPRKLIL